MPNRFAGLTAYVNEQLVHHADFTHTVELIDVTPAFDTYGPDPKWTFTDSKGHFHAASADQDHPWPTLEQRFHEHGDPDDPDDVWTTSYFVCSICEAEIEPNMIVIKSAGWREEAPGRKSWNAMIEVMNGTPLYTGDKVSFRALVGDEQEIFGVAIVTGVEYRALNAVMVINLEGVSPLGTRKLH